MYSKLQRIVAEFVGKFALIFFGAGSICADQFLKSTNQGSLGLLGIAVAHGLAIAIMVTAVGHISGGHLRSEEHTSELQSRLHLVCRLLLEKKKVTSLRLSRIL